MATAGTVARGNGKSREYAKSKRLLGPEASAIKVAQKVARQELKGLENRLTTVGEQVKLCESRLAELTRRALEDVDQERTDANKRRVDQVVKILAAWDKVGRACRIELGIVTQRSLNQATREAETTADSGFDRTMREFQD